MIFESQLSVVEREELAELLRLEKQKYQAQANNKFDSSKNWSIMIKKDCNDERNEIMRKFKFQQMKKHKLHEFSRKERERITKQRDEKKNNYINAEDSDAMSHGRPSTAATTTHTVYEEKRSLKEMSEEERKGKIYSEFMDYMGSFVTKNNVKTLPGTVNHAKAEMERRALLNQIKQGETKEEDAPDPTVTEVA